MWQNDYLKFVLNLKQYVNLPLEFLKSDEKYPIVKLGDITLYFNHYNTEEEARGCWNKRRKRINYDNLFLIMYDKDGLTKEDLEKLKKLTVKEKL